MRHGLNFQLTPIVPAQCATSSVITVNSHKCSLLGLQETSAILLYTGVTICV